MIERRVADSALAGAVRYLCFWMQGDCPVQLRFTRTLSSELEFGHCGSQRFVLLDEVDSAANAAYVKL